MAILLASAAFAATVVSNCSWNDPGRHPYRGTVTEAVSRYADIPAPVQRELARKISAGNADDQVTITRDGIAGARTYDPVIRGMHFGQRTVCDTVTRERWSATAQEPAAVYCAGGHCLAVPRVCGNVSRVQLLGGAGGGGRATHYPGAVPVPPPGLRPRHEPPGAEVDVVLTDGFALLIMRREPEPAGPVPSAGWDNPLNESRWFPPLMPEPDALIPLPVAEPGTGAMFGLGVALLALVAARARRAAHR
jgi:hypothetical protein